MSEVRTIHRMTPDAFFLWQAGQDRNYELVDGVPVPAKAMTGATRRHDRVIVNTLRLLANQLTGRQCFPSTADITVQNPNGSIRRPDVTIDCGNDSDRSTQAVDPRVVIEVLSPSTTRFDRFLKIEEYKTNTAIRVILVVDTEAAEIICWRRIGADWDYEVVKGLGAIVQLPEVDAELPLAELYAGVRLEKTRGDEG